MQSMGVLIQINADFVVMSDNPVVTSVFSLERNLQNVL